MYQITWASGRYPSSGAIIDLSGKLTRSPRRQWSLFTNLTMPSSRRW